MKDLKNKLISLSLALTMISSLSGCKTTDLSLETTKKDEKLVGEIYEEDLRYCYIVEVNEYNQRKLYFVYDKNKTSDNVYEIVKSLCNTNGEIENIIPFQYFVDIFGEEKELYTSNDIEMILHETEKEYYSIKEDKDVKKLEQK